MWTAENRARYERRGLRYPSDLTDAEWELVARACNVVGSSRGGADPTWVIGRSEAGIELAK